MFMGDLHSAGFNSDIHKQLRVQLLTASTIRESGKLGRYFAEEESFSEMVSEENENFVLDFLIKGIESLQWNK